MAETLRQACEEFRGGRVSLSVNGEMKDYTVNQVIAFLDRGGTEAQIAAGALDKDADAHDRIYRAETMARFLP